MRRRHGLTLGVLAALAVAVFAARSTTHRPPPLATGAVSTPVRIQAAIGFRSRGQLIEHFQKHGREFGAPDADAYLRLAQTLRDRPMGGDVLEQRRGDGTITRYDRAAGAFLAYDPDLTIRTYFKPNDGEQYFRRQAMRDH
jgi:hypothetical protein